TFVDQQGRRCRGTRAMEYHHDRPYGKGGQHEASSIVLRCRAHNRYQADLDFGREFMRDKRGSNSPHSARNVRGPLVRAEMRRHRREWKRFRKAFVFVAARLVNEARQVHVRIANSHRFGDAICRGVVRLQIGALGDRLFQG
ncbi:MAG: hypothetical protein V3R77_02530, partial [Candidatus Binatia bacterium]